MSTRFTGFKAHSTLTRWLARGAVTALVLSGLAIASAAVEAPVTATAQESHTSDDGVAVTESEAIEEAAATGAPVTVLSGMSEYRDVVANPDGSLTAKEYVNPVRTLVDDEWVDIDTTLEVGDDGSIAPVATTVDLVISGGGDTTLLEVDKNGRTVQFGWEQVLPAPSIEGDTATYAEVFPEVDLQVTALPDGFSHVLVVKTPEAAENPDLAEIDMPITTDGATVSTDADGGVLVTDDGSDGPLLTADTPMMWDSSGTATEGVETFSTASQTAQQRAPVGVEADADSLTLTPDAAMLASASTVFPVYIDPIYRESASSAWTMVFKQYPNEEYWKFDGEDNEGLGYCNNLWPNCHSNGVKRLFYRVPTSKYVDKQILSATFAVTLQHNWSGSNTGDNADLYLMNSGISSSTNWNNQPSGSQIATADTPAPSSSCSSSSTYATEWDVKPEVADAASDGRKSLTFGLRNASETDNTKWMRFCDNAYLSVKYNTRPDRPDTDDMGSRPGGACQYAIDAGSYVNKLPTIFATLTDPDHGAKTWAGGGTVAEHLRAEFELVWGANDAHRWTAPLSAAKASGSEFRLNLATASGLPDIPEGEPIGFVVRAYDGHSYGPWSWEGSDQERCRFVYDTTAPEPPTITSADFPDGDAIVPMIGETGALTITPADADIEKYIIDFNKDDAGPQTITLPSLGAAHTVEFMPTVPGRQLCTVTAVDAAGNSARTVYTFRVSVAPAAGKWELDEPADSAEVTDADGGNAGTVGPGVELGVDGPGAYTAAAFDGTSGAYIDTTDRGIVPTAEGFSAAAWVRVDDLSRDQAAVSVNGSGEAGFVLGYHSLGANSGEWMMQIADMDGLGFTDWRVAGGEVDTANQGEWVHLVGVYDDRDSSMTLYVNGTQVATAERESTWNATNDVQIGRAKDGGYYTYRWSGGLAEVQVFDRLVPAAEAAELGEVLPHRAGYWQLNSATDGELVEVDGGVSAYLGGTAEIYQRITPRDPVALNGVGHLELDGLSAYAALPDPMVDTEKSFSLTARVRPASVAPEQDMTVLAIAGAQESMVEVRYNATLEQWELIVTGADITGAETVTVASPVALHADTAGQSIAVVYDDVLGSLTLYVDGVASAPIADPLFDTWSATSGLQIGRSLNGGAYGDHFSGAIDEVRAYTGALNRSAVQLIADPANEHPEI